MAKKKRIFRMTLDGSPIPTVTTNLVGLYELFNNYVNNETSYTYTIEEVNENGEFLRTIVAIGKNHAKGYCDEGCPHCGNDTPFYAEFKSFHCTNCGKSILPCSLCDHDKVNCNECPLKGKNRNKLGGII